MQIGLVINRINAEEKMIIKAAEKHSIKVVRFNDQRLKLTLNTKKDLGESADIFLQRSLSFSRGLHTAAILENKGYHVINNYNCLNLTGNKLLTTLVLEKNGIPTPNTYVAFRPESAVEAINDLGSYPAITKPIIGSWGRLVAKINDSDAARALFEAKEVLGSTFQKIYYIQDYITTPENEPTDIRVFFIGGQCIAAMGRYKVSGDFRSNIAIGGTAKPYEIDDDLEKLSKKVAEAFKGEILGIDFMKTENGYICIEVNGTPGFAGIVKTTGIDIGEEIIKYIKEKYA